MRKTTRRHTPGYALVWFLRGAIAAGQSEDAEARKSLGIRENEVFRGDRVAALERFGRFSRQVQVDSPGRDLVE